jgi:ParB-like partition proteins
MKSSGRNISLTSYDDIFSSEESRSGVRQERVQDIPLAQLHPFKDHPFRVVDDERMTETAESVKEYGVLVPAIARPMPDGGYELVSGHRRKRACELAGLETMPVIVRELDDDQAVIIMVDSNLQRENILPSERAKAYQMKYEALKHQGQRRDLTSGQNVQKSESSLEQVAEGTGDSAKTVQRVMRLNNLVPEMLSMVDDKKVAMTPAFELSYLKPEEQQQLVETMETCQSTPSLSQAQRMKRFSQQGKLTGDVMEEIMSEEKKPPLDKVILTGEKIRRFFPKSYTPEQMEKVIIKLLETWYRKRMQSHER